MSITLIITLIGIVLQTLWTAVSTFSSTQNRFYRRVLIFLAFVGAIVSIVGSFIASREQQGLREAVAKQTVLLDQQEKRLEEVKAVLNLVSVTVGDLGSLDRLTGGSKYYVRIAADSDRNRLVPYLERIERQFKGARSSGLVAIRAPRKGSRLYELVFGQNLTVTAAEVFQRLAMSHRLPPPGDVAVIVPEE